MPAKQARKGRRAPAGLSEPTQKSGSHIPHMTTRCSRSSGTAYRIPSDPKQER